MNPGEAGFTVVRVVSCGSSRLLSGLWFLEGGLEGSVSFREGCAPYFSWNRSGQNPAFRGPADVQAAGEFQIC